MKSKLFAVHAIFPIQNTSMPQGPSLLHLCSKFQGIPLFWAIIWPVFSSPQLFPFCSAQAEAGMEIFAKPFGHRLLAYKFFLHLYHACSPFLNALCVSIGPF